MPFFLKIYKSMQGRQFLMLAYKTFDLLKGRQCLFKWWWVLWLRRVHQYDTRAFYEARVPTLLIWWVWVSWLSAGDRRGRGWIGHIELRIAKSVAFFRKWWHMGNKIGQWKCSHALCYWLPVRRDVRTDGAWLIVGCAGICPFGKGTETGITTWGERRSREKNVFMASIKVMFAVLMNGLGEWSRGCQMKSVANFGTDSKVVGHLMLCFFLLEESLSIIFFAYSGI